MKLSLWTLPDILIVHLKRFSQVGERRNKLSTLVKFPLCGLNMAPHVAQRSAGPAPGAWPSWTQPACLPTSCPLDFLYDLYAVCNHHGSLQGGHYTGELCRWLGAGASGRRARSATARELTPSRAPASAAGRQLGPRCRAELRWWWE